MLGMKFINTLLVSLAIQTSVFTLFCAEAVAKAGDVRYAAIIQGKASSKELQTLLSGLQKTLEAHVEQEIPDTDYLRYRFEKDRVFLKKSLHAEPA